MKIAIAMREMKWTPARQGRLPSRICLLKSIGLFLVCLSSPFALPAQTKGAESGAAVTVLYGGNLIDGTGAAVRTNVDIFIAGDRITDIVSSSERRIPGGSNVIDVRGKWIIPGLIDSHVHYDPWMADLFLYHGVTSVFDTGNETKAILEQREAIRSGRVKGPRLFVCGEALRGLPPVGSGAEGGETARDAIKSAEDARVRTVELLEQGVDAIKVNVWVPAEWIRVVAAEAHARNKPVLGHLSTPAKEAIEAGLDALVHPYAIDLSTLSDPAKIEFIRKNMPLYVQRKEYYPYYLLEPARYSPLITMMVRKGTFFNPTFGAQFRGVYPEREEFDEYDSTFLDLRSQELGYLVSPIKKKLLPFFGRLRFHEIDPDMRKKLELGMENVAEFMRRFSHHGGRMVAGTDTSTIGIPGVRLHRELQLWVARGISPIEAIRGATRYPAELFRLSDLGTIEVGKKADIIVLNGNPLEDIRLIGAIDKVFLDGKPVRRELNAASFIALVREK